MPQIPDLTRKKSFWRSRYKSTSEDSPLFSRSDTLDSHPANGLLPSRTEGGPTIKPRRYRLVRFVEWIKSFSRRKDEVKESHAYEQLQSYGHSSASRIIEALQHTENIHESQRLLGPLADNTLPAPGLALDGANDELPTQLVSFEFGQPKCISRRSSFFYLRDRVHERSSPGIRPSRSTPGFIRRRLSQHFQGTVVRRSGARPQAILAPLSLNMFSQPTAETSPSSCSTSPSFGEISVGGILPRPTLRTIEVAAGTKFYLESHFSQLLSSPTSRSIRRRNFESQLIRKVPSEQKRRSLREEWRRKETAHLRSLRSKPLNVGNYEIVKVIGKGAFGVVNLVREKPENMGDDNYPDIMAPLDVISSEYEAGGAIGKEIQDSRIRSISSAEGSEHAADTNKKPSNASKVYALKVMRKADMLTGGQEGHLRAERDFLVASQGSRWIVPLVAAFQDKDNLYLVMEYLIGGDFLALLIKKTVLSEEETRFYIAEMICCIEEAHGLGYIHRDVKPDNFLFNSEGHLKLCDFGLAFSGHRTHDGEYLDRQRQSLLSRVGLQVEGDSIDRKEAKRALAQLSEKTPHRATEWQVREEIETPAEWLKTDRGLARSVVGTNQYMAPEVIRGEAYDGRCDWWSLGIILYECLYGFTPFYSRKRSETRSKIMNWATTLTFPSKPQISPQAYHLIASLLCEKQHRISSRMYASNDLYNQDGHVPPPCGAENIHPTRANEMARSRGMNQNYYEYDRSIKHVLPFDARDIKAHPFFQEINWQQLHTMRPPFPPEGLTGNDDTKYFDYEDYGDSGQSSPSERSGDVILRAATAPLDANGGPQQQPAHADENELKVTKRARDKLLRDPVHGEQLLDLRKQVAFWGYTYRRPRTLDTFESDISGRRRVTLAECAGIAGNRWSHALESTDVSSSGVTSTTGGYSGTTLQGEGSED